jgi:hypothetical protein
MRWAMMPLGQERREGIDLSAIPASSRGHLARLGGPRPPVTGTYLMNVYAVIKLHEE